MDGHWIQVEFVKKNPAGHEVQIFGLDVLHDEQAELHIKLHVFDVVLRLYVELHCVQMFVLVTL